VQLAEAEAPQPLSKVAGEGGDGGIRTGAFGVAASGNGLFAAVARETPFNKVISTMCAHLTTCQSPKLPAKHPKGMPFLALAAA
jgi:hypothetical protein